MSMKSMEESLLTQDEKDEFRMGAGGGESRRDIHIPICFTNHEIELDVLYRTKGRKHWRYKLVHLMHSVPVQVFLAVLLFIDVLALIIELVLQAEYPPEQILERTCLCEPSGFFEEAAAQLPSTLLATLNSEFGVGERGVEGVEVAGTENREEGAFLGENIRGGFAGIANHFGFGENAEPGMSATEDLISADAAETWKQIKEAIQQVVAEKNSAELIATNMARHAESTGETVAAAENLASEAEGRTEGGAELTESQEVFLENACVREIEEHPHAVEQAEVALYGISIAILLVFDLEFFFLILALRDLFFRNLPYLIDFIIVNISLVIEIHFFKRTGAEGVAGLLIFIRVWRFVRIGHGVYSDAHEYGGHKLMKLRKQLAEANDQIKLLQAEQQPQSQTEVSVS
mmetsp:Transcript_18135/g.22357  ORF Transcript_18135/g.22357 Transcript_18135/m.22357 type:complete len:403 (+) Transcript_18135:196-1404(+)